MRLCFQLFLIIFYLLGISTAGDNPYKQINLQEISVLNKESKVHCLEWGNEEQTEILIGRGNQLIQVFDVSTNEFQSNVQVIKGPIVGLARYDGKIIAGIESGEIQILEDKPEQPILINTGDNLSVIRQCPVERKLIASGGKDRQNNLKIWDLSTQKKVFTSKNVPNDTLELEVPVWDTDLSFMDKSTLATCSRHGYIRYYDTRAQRRPVLDNENVEQISYSCLATHERMIFVGTTTGILRAYDSRNLKTYVHTYKGFTGSLTDIGIDPTGNYLFTSSLDRFVRIYAAGKPQLMYQCYVKTKATKILLKTIGMAGKLVDEVEEATIEEENNVSEDSEYEELFDKMPTVQ